MEAPIDRHVTHYKNSRNPVQTKPSSIQERLQYGPFFGNPHGPLEAPSYPDFSSFPGKKTNMLEEAHRETFWKNHQPVTRSRRAPRRGARLSAIGSSACNETLARWRLLQTGSSPQLVYIYICRNKYIYVVIFFLFIRLREACAVPASEKLPPETPAGTCYLTEPGKLGANNLGLLSMNNWLLYGIVMWPVSWGYLAFQE